MKFPWHNTITNLAAWNSTEIEEVDLECYVDLLETDKMFAQFDKEVEVDEMVFDFATFV